MLAYSFSNTAEAMPRKISASLSIIGFEMVPGFELSVFDRFTSTKLLQCRVK